MQPFILTLRAIGTELALRLYVPAAATALLIVALLVIGAGWLTTFSQWWWLLFVPLVIGISVVIGVATVLLLVIRSVRPAQNKEQKQAVKQFVDKVQGVAEVVGTPKFIILFWVIRSVAAPSKESYLSDLVANKNLASDFRQLQRHFTAKT